MPAIIVTGKLLRNLGATPENAARYAPELAVQCHSAGITTRLRIAHFLGQVFHESARLHTVEENLNYSADRLLAVFPKHYKTRSMALQHARNPVLIANHVYADRLGNGSETSGDGYRFRGRGLIQLTGRENYARFFMWIGAPVATPPSSVATVPRYAVASAIWFWGKRAINAVADTDNVEAVTRLVNGGTNGLADRRALTERAKQLLAD